MIAALIAKQNLEDQLSIDEQHALKKKKREAAKAKAAPNKRQRKGTEPDAQDSADKDCAVSELPEDGELPESCRQHHGKMLRLPRAAWPVGPTRGAHNYTLSKTGSVNRITVRHGSKASELHSIGL